MAGNGLGRGGAHPSAAAAFLVRHCGPAAGAKFRGLGSNFWIAWCSYSGKLKAQGKNHPCTGPIMKNHPQSVVRARRLRRGFSLLEMVIVLGIIALILGGAIALMGNVGEGAKMQRVDQDFNSIGSALRMYKINNNTYPTTAQGLKALVDRPSTTPAPRRWTQLMKAVPKDPWNNEYDYRFPGSRDASEFEIISRGKDGMAGTADDLSSQQD